MRLVDRLIAWSLPWVPKPIVRNFSKPYIAGISIDDAMECTLALRAEGARVTLDILGEFINSLEQASQTTQAYQTLLRTIHARKIEQTNVSVKLTALGLLLDRKACELNLEELLKTATELDNFVRIDMEDSSCTDATLEIYRTMRQKYPGRVGCVLQSRLRRTLDDVLQLVDSPTSVRLCKGIYLEPRAIAFTDAELIRENFIDLLEQLFTAGAYVGIATHDERLVWHAERLIRKHGLTKDQYEFQMLLGVEGAMRQRLLDKGHPLRVYVPFGEDWYAYSVRRLKENPQIAGHAFRAMFKNDH